MSSRGARDFARAPLGGPYRAIKDTEVLTFWDPSGTTPVAVGTNAMRGYGLVPRAVSLRGACGRPGVLHYRDSLD